ncbi:MAG: bis-aminopropyl spermidine synthase family protein [Candidatus Binatia bacterium]
MALDLRLALNALSDVVANRPSPLREFDQIYMKFGDLVVHAEFMARRLRDQRVVFVGDGDAVGLSLAHLLNEKVFEHGPSRMTVLDFDERQVNSINNFATRYECEGLIGAHLYNVIDALPSAMVGSFDAFHINPPWGQHNDGESVAVFLERAIHLVRVGGLGIVVIADDESLDWTNQVLRRAQATALQHGMIVAQMVPSLHSYHLEDAPELRSCALILRKIGPDTVQNSRLDPRRLDNFYGRANPLRIHYVREAPGVGRGKADDRTYSLEKFKSGGETNR